MPLMGSPSCPLPPVSLEEACPHPTFFQIPKVSILGAQFHCTPQPLSPVRSPGDLETQSSQGQEDTRSTL